MQNVDDQELLRRCATSRSDEAFSEAFSALVSRHLDLVYSSALRQVRDPHLAKDVAQSVFLLLAKKSRTLHHDTILTGWLYRTTRFVVSDTLRAENRRRAREHAAMQPPVSELYSHHSSPHPTSQEPRWEEIEPLLDDAIATLNEQDRDLVLLRYFEKQSLKEVGRRLGINEDAAQKRVSRALEKLRAFFATRGASTTTVALAAMLSNSAVQSAPAGVASAIFTAVTVAAPAVGVALSSFTLQSLLETMALTKTKTVIATALLVALTVPTVTLVTQNRALKQARDENQALKASLQLQPTSTSPATNDPAPLITAADLARLRSDAAEVHRLRGEVTLLRQASRNTPSPSAQPADPLDPAVQNNPMQRMTLGRDFMAQGKYPEALEHFLWCYDEGLKHSPSYVGVRSSFLLNDLKNLAKVYPPAREALLARRDTAEQAIINTSADLASVLQYHQLNEHLDQPAHTLELFDQLPVGHRARAAMVDVALEQFLTARRYHDILEAGNPEATFDRAKGAFSSVAENSPGREDLQAIIRRRAVESGASALEALAGAGQVDRAIALANSVLDFDSSPETRGQLLKHAQRANHPQVLAHLQNPPPR